MAPVHRTAALGVFVFTGGVVMSAEVEYLSPSQAAARVGVSHQTIVAWMDAGRLRGLRTPIGRLIEKQDADRVAAARQARQASPDGAA